MIRNFREVNSIKEANRPAIRLLEPAMTAFPFCLPRIFGNAHFDFFHKSEKVTLLCFWSTEVEKSLLAVNHLDNWYRESEIGNFEVIAINCDQFKPDSIFNSARPSGIKMLWDQDGLTKNMYKINHFPTTVLIDKFGKIRDEKTGGPLNDWARLNLRVASLAAER